MPTGKIATRIERLVRDVVRHCERKYDDVEDHERVDSQLARRLARIKADTTQLEERAAHWREIANPIGDKRC